MEHRRFGRTGLRVPAITFGGGWVGGVLIHGNEQTASAALDTAWNNGVDWIDTAASYGDGASETAIGRWLAGRKAQQRPGLSTKFRLDTSAGDFRDQMLQSVEQSFYRLGVDKVPLIILHNKLSDEGTGDGALSADDALRARDDMEKLRDLGLCDWLGMTALGDPDALHTVVGSGRFDVAQVYYNMLNPTAAAGQDMWNSTDFRGLLDVCTEHDMGVMGIRIFAGGHLVTAERHGREIPVTEHADNASEEARAQCVWAVLHDEDGTYAQQAVRFGLANESISTIVVGLGELEHLRLAIDAAEMGPLPAARTRVISEAWEHAVFRF